MRELLKELGIAEGKNFAELILLAAAMHADLVKGKPDEEGPVSRSTLMRAALVLSPILRQILTECGLHVPGFVGANPDLIRHVEDIEVNEFVPDALEAFVRLWPGRPLDAFGLGAAIVMAAHSVVEQRLRSSGLKLDVARQRLLLAVVADEAARAWDRNAIVPFKSINDFSFSKGCRAWIERACTRVERSDALPPVVTASVLMAAALEDHVEPLPDVTLPPGIVQSWMSWYVTLFSESIPTSITVAALDAIGAARDHAQTVANRPMIHSEDLLAMLLTRKTGARDFLEFAGLRASDLAKTLMAYVERKHPEQDLDAWRKLLNLAIPPPRHVRAPVDIESLDGDDLLGFQRDVDSFAKLIAAKDLTPPLSIGLFGDWGSGKSFFMKRLQKRIDVLASEAREREERSAFHSRIVQIQFNAWHYVEANLWASLVEHIFRNLRFAGETDDDAETRRTEILKELDSAIAKRIDAEKEVADRQHERDAKAHELDLKQHEADTAAARFRRVMSVKPWEAVPLSGADQKSVDEALDAIGMEKVVKTAASAREVVGELASIRNRARVMRKWLWTQSKGRTACVLAVLVAPVVITFFARKLGVFATAIADVSAVLLAVVGWIGTNAKTLKEVFAKIERAKLAVDETFLRYQNERDAELERSRADQEKAEAELAKAKKALHAADDAVRDAEQKLAELAPDRQLSRFIADRAASDDYRKLLGVLAMVRNDFEKLSDLLTRQTTAGDRRIDRIVLYIDDLDRCPPQRVVEVLQAVHLLLAFKLFVVVVGVDARWVARALETRHKSQWRNAGRRAGDALPGYGATPEDYLEKIFQVPFWIQPMSADATRELLRGIVKVKAREEETRAEAPIVEPDTPKRVITRAEVPELPGGNSYIEIAKLPIRAGDDEHNPEALQLEQAERDAMEKLAPLILRSPRSVKRFANVYRLVRAGIDADQLPPYLEGAYEQTLLLLGLICGTPSAAPELFHRIRIAKGDEDLKTFVSSLGHSGWPPKTLEHVEWTRAVDALAGFASTREQLTVNDLRDDIRRLGRYSFRPGSA